MKIIKTKLNKEAGVIVAYTDEDESMGFCLDIDNIKDRADLEKQVQKRVDEIKIKKDKEKERQQKYEEIKCQTQI